jgi:phosphoglycerate dehydrogenase-like enzyme
MVAGTTGGSPPTSPATCTAPLSGWSATGVSRVVWRKRAAGFDMKVIHTARSDTGLSGYVALRELLARADIVSLHVPLTQSTRYLIGSVELALMKSTAILVNTARGSTSSLASPA